ncbi:MAG: hypothetical protein ACE5HO_09345 [bacterium]
MEKRLELPDFSEQALQAVPLERAETIPSSWYVHPRFHEFEKASVLARTWQYVGNVGQVQQEDIEICEHVQKGLTPATAAASPSSVNRGSTTFTVCSRRRFGMVLNDEDG